MTVDPPGNDHETTGVALRERELRANGPRGLADSARILIEQAAAAFALVRSRFAQRSLPGPALTDTAVGQPIPRGLVLRPALLGFVALLAIVVGDSFPSSPFKFEMPGAWFFGTPSSGGASSWGVYFVLAAVYGGLLLLMRVWWGMVRLYARCPGA